MNVLILPGHGGKDSGAVSANGTEEDDLNLGIAIQLSNLFLEAGDNPILSRDEDIYLSPSEQLAKIRELKPDCAIAIHCNSSKNEEAKGVEVFFKDDNDYPLASAIYQYLCAYTGMKQRGVKKDERGLAVLKDEPIASVLIEFGFISNPEEFDYMLRNLDLFAQCTFEGVKAWESLL